MALLTSIVDLDTIQVKNLSFVPAQKTVQIEALANTIIDLDGLVNVPVVQQINVDEYELLSGYLEYYAYLKAREINFNLPDRIPVFVSTAKNQEAILQQLDVLQIIEKNEQSSSQVTNSKQSELDLKIKNLEASINNNGKIFSTALEDVKAEMLAALDAKLPRPIPPLDAFNRISEPDVALQVQRKLEILSASKAKKVVARLQEVSKRDNHKPFQGFAEILNALKVEQGGRLTRLISEEKMITIIDRWNY